MKEKKCPALPDCEARFDRIERILFVVLGVLIGVGVLDVGKLAAGL